MIKKIRDKLRTAVGQKADTGMQFLSSGLLVLLNELGRLFGLCAAYHDRASKSPDHDSAS